MKWFLDLKIGVKLLLAFSVAAAFTALLGIFSIFQLDRVNQTSTDIARNWMPGARLTAGMNTITSDFRLAEVQHILSTSETEMSRFEAELGDVAARLDAAAERYKALVSSPDERTIWDSFEKNWAAYLIEHERIMTLSRANERAEATALVRDQSRKWFDAGNADLLKLAQLNVAGGERASASGDEVNESARRLILLALCASVLASLLLAWWTARMISRPLVRAVEAARLVADGDLTAHIDANGRDETGQLLTSLKQMNQSLVEVVGNVRRASERIAVNSDKIADGNSDLARRAETQASNLQQTAASMEEITATVKNNSESASQASDLSSTASEVAEKGGEVVDRVVHTMRDISDSSARIADIVGVIDGIAFQTNILALNAAVEAARAGEQGRGFAVVASEVRSLAKRSAEAAMEIKELIEESVRKVENGSRLVDDAGNSMQDIVGQVKQVSQLISEISTAGAEQTQGIGQIGTAVNELDMVVQQNSLLVTESSTTAEKLRSQAMELNEAVSVFKLVA